MIHRHSPAVRFTIGASGVALPIVCAGAGDSTLPAVTPYSALPPAMYIALMFAMALYGYFGSTKPFAMISAVVLAIFLAIVESTINAARGFPAEACTSVLVPIVGFMFSYAVGVVAGLKKSIVFLLVGSVVADIFAKLIAINIVRDLPFGLCGAHGMHL
jgi:hypothetical protein